MISGLLWNRAKTSPEYAVSAFTLNLASYPSSFTVDALLPNVSVSVVTDAEHPDDDNGTMFLTAGFYDSMNYPKILQDDEHYSIYTDKAQRRFNTSEPLQLSVSEDGRLNARFYSPRDLSDVLIRAKIPAVGDEYLDLAYFDRIPAFADFSETLPMLGRRTWYRTESGKIIHVLFIQTIENHKIVLGDCPFEKGLVITVEFPVIIVLVPGLGKAVKSSYELT